MRRLARPKPFSDALGDCADRVVAIGQYLRLFERAWFNLNTLWQPMNAQSIGLDRYRVVLEARSSKAWTTMSRR
jgi:hypothetical protein